jgi:hypothetical protein
MSFVVWWTKELPKCKNRYERAIELIKDFEYGDALVLSEDAIGSIDDMLSAEIPMSQEECDEIYTLKQKLLLQSSVLHYTLCCSGTTYESSLALAEEALNTYPTNKDMTLMAGIYRHKGRVQFELNNLVASRNDLKFCFELEKTHNVGLIDATIELLRKVERKIEEAGLSATPKIRKIKTVKKTERKPDTTFSSNTNGGSLPDLVSHEEEVYESPERNSTTIHPSVMPHPSFLSQTFGTPQIRASFARIEVMNENETIQFVLDAKKHANEFFNKKQYDMALYGYCLCLHSMRKYYSRMMMPMGMSSRADEVSNLRATLVSNQAACLLKLKRWREAVNTLKDMFDCNRIAIRHKGKAYYRRACAYIGLEEWENAARDLETASLIFPSNVKIRKAYREIRMKLNGADKSDDESDSEMPSLVHDEDDEENQEEEEDDEEKQSDDRAIAQFDALLQKWDTIRGGKNTAVSEIEDFVIIYEDAMDANNVLGSSEKATIEGCQSMKAEAKGFFRRGEYKKASEIYKKVFVVVALSKWTRNSPELKLLGQQCVANTSACLLKLKEYGQCALYCAMILRGDDVIETIKSVSRSEETSDTLKKYEECLLSCIMMLRSSELDLDIKIKTNMRWCKALIEGEHYDEANLHLNEVMTLIKIEVPSSKQAQYQKIRKQAMALMKSISNITPEVISSEEENEKTDEEMPDLDYDSEDNGTNDDNGGKNINHMQMLEALRANIPMDSKSEKENIKLCQSIKEQATEFFHRGEYKKASDMYKLVFLAVESSKWKLNSPELRLLGHQCRANSSACLLKLNKYDECISNCAMMLRDAELNLGIKIKTHMRYGRALMKKKQYGEAAQHLIQVMSLIQNEVPSSKQAQYQKMHKHAMALMESISKYVSSTFEHAEDEPDEEEEENNNNTMKNKTRSTKDTESKTKTKSGKKKKKKKRKKKKKKKKKIEEKDEEETDDDMPELISDDDDDE